MTTRWRRCSGSPTGWHTRTRAAAPPAPDPVRAMSPFPPADEAFLERLHGMLTADSLEHLLVDGAGALAALVEGPCAAAFLIEANHVLAEGWSSPPPAGSMAPTLRSLALESVRTGRPVTLPIEPGADGH